MPSARASSPPRIFPSSSPPRAAPCAKPWPRPAYEHLLESLGPSRWLALGRLIGASPRLATGAPTAEARLAALRKACASSAWVRLGEKLGFVYTGAEEKSNLR